MLKKCLIAAFALGVVGAVSTTASAPANAFFFCKPDKTYAEGTWCAKRAERKAKWAAWWQARRDAHKDRKSRRK